MNSLDIGPFWLCWTLTIALVVWQLARSLRNPAMALGFPTVVGLLWLYFYVILPYQFVRQATGALDPNILVIAQFQALLAYCSLLAGWHYGLAGRQAHRPQSTPTFDLDRLWGWGVGLQLFGLVAGYTFHASGRLPSDSSAYWYMLPQFCFPGMSLCAAVLTLVPRLRKTENYLIFVTLALLTIWPYLFGARRGPTFVAIIALTFSHLLMRPRLPRAGQIYGILIASGFLLMCLVTARNVLYQEGGTWTAVFEQIGFQDVIDDRTKTTGDNEFYNGCLLVEADLRTGKYQYGTTHLAMLVHWIPRSWWPGKPQRNQGFFPSAMDEIAASEQSDLGIGGAWGAVADTFDNYWWFFPVFWFVTGWGIAAIYRRAILGNELNWKLHYVGVLCAVHWFIAQCLPEALVPALFFQAGYYLAFRAARIHAPRLRRRARGREAAPVPDTT